MTRVLTSSSLVLGRKSFILGGPAATKNSSSPSFGPEVMMWTSPLKMLRQKILTILLIYSK
jgi:hypothetical protein